MCISKGSQYRKWWWTKVNTHAATRRFQTLPKYTGVTSKDQQHLRAEYSHLINKQNTQNSKGKSWVYQSSQRQHDIEWEIFLSNVYGTQNIMRKAKVIFNSKSTMHTREVYIAKVIKILTIDVDGKPSVHTITMLSDSINVNLPPKCTYANSDGRFSSATNLQTVVMFAPGYKGIFGKTTPGC